jgi:hypothetical protein
MDPQAYQDTLPVIRADVPGVTAWTMEPFNGYAVHLPHKLMEQIEARALARAETYIVQMEVARDAAVSERAMAMEIVAAVAKALADLRNDEMSDLEHSHLDSRFREFARRVRSILAHPDSTGARE